MRFFINSQTRILLHGIHTLIGQSLINTYSSHGINIVGGVEAGTGGGWGAEGRIPIFDSVNSGKKATSADAVVICVAPQFGYEAILESVNEEINTIVCLTGGLPVNDLSKIRSLLRMKDIHFIGPQSFGIISPGNFVLGSPVWNRSRKGYVGLIARSESLALETTLLLAENGLGISTAVGLSRYGDVGIDLLEMLTRFDQDPETTCIAVIENARTEYNEETREFIADTLSKPIVAYLPGKNNPTEEKNSYAGLKANLSFQYYQSKVEEIRNAGIPLVDNLFGINDFLVNL